MGYSMITNSEEGSSGGILLGMQVTGMNKTTKSMSMRREKGQGGTRVHQRTKCVLWIWPSRSKKSAAIGQRQNLLF